MSPRPDPHQFRRRSDAAGWYLRERIEKQRRQARACAVWSAAVAVLSVAIGLGLTFVPSIGPAAPVLWIVLGFGALCVSAAAAGEAR